MAYNSLKQNRLVKLARKHKKELDTKRKKIALLNIIKAAKQQQKMSLGCFKKLFMQHIKQESETK